MCRCAASTYPDLIVRCCSPSYDTVFIGSMDEFQGRICHRTQQNFLLRVTQGQHVLPAAHLMNHASRLACTGNRCTCSWTTTGLRTNSSKATEQDPHSVHVTCKSPDVPGCKATQTNQVLADVAVLPA